MHHYFNKLKNIRELDRGIIDFKKGYQPRTYIVKDKKSDLVTDFHSILPRWRNHFSQLLNIHGVNDVRQTEIHTTEPLMPEPSASEVELAINLLFLFGIRRHCQKSGRSRSLYLSVRKAIKQTVIIIAGYQFCQLHTKFYPTSCCQGLLHMQRKLLRIISVDFECDRSTTDHIFCICQILQKKWEYNEAVHQLFIEFKKAYDSFRREVLYNIFIEFGISMKQVRLINICLKENYSRVRLGKH